MRQAALANRHVAHADAIRYLEEWLSLAESRSRRPLDPYTNGTMHLGLVVAGSTPATIPTTSLATFVNNVVIIVILGAIATVLAHVNDNDHELSASEAIYQCHKLQILCFIIMMETAAS